MFASDKGVSWVFDCDGVILDSNLIKTEVFRELVQPFGEEISLPFLKFHRENGGLSRHKKFEYLFEGLLKLQEKESSVRISQAVEDFTEKALERLLQCNVVVGVGDFLNSLPKNSPKFVISGGLQSEVRTVLREKKLDTYFTDILGSPVSKEDHIRRLLDCKSLKMPAVFIGDSRLDYETAIGFGMDFIFLTNYTQFIDWPDFFRDKPVVIAQDFEDLSRKLKTR